MSTNTESKGYNRKSYFWTMLFILPAFAISNIAARSNETISGIAKLVSLILAVIIIIWTIKRLRNAGRSGWWSLALIPPATLFLLIYTFFTPSTKEHEEVTTVVYGIEPKGFWKISAIAALSLFLVYLSALFATFLSDGL